MVNERLHIICGNCGNNKMFDYSVDYDECEDRTNIVIRCNNCATLHWLDSVIPEADQEPHHEND